MDNTKNIENSSTDDKLDSSKILFVSNKIKRVKNWTPEEDQILLRTAKEFNNRNWKAVAKFFEDRSPIQCSARFKRIRPGIVKGPWTIHEDIELEEYIKQYGCNWSLLAKFMPSRSGKQIRDRYLNALNPEINKKKFTLEEDKKIIELYTKLGTAWTKIARSFKGRTGDLIKNRFYSSLRRRIHASDANKEKINKIKKIKLRLSKVEDSDRFAKLEQELKKGTTSIRIVIKLYYRNR